MGFITVRPPFGDFLFFSYHPTSKPKPNIYHILQVMASQPTPLWNMAKLILKHWFILVTHHPHASPGCFSLRLMLMKPRGADTSTCQKACASSDSVDLTLGNFTTSVTWDLWKLRCQVSNENRAPGCFEYIGDEILPSYAGIVINPYKYKDLCSTTSISWNVFDFCSFLVAQVTLYGKQTWRLLDVFFDIYIYREDILPKVHRFHSSSLPC